ncbi:NACHT and ankyrin domain protein [Pochonia chlamydosporia 170]|uniref:NACHT and ankyrin domain protein n=1 Tax=Pochonia chlamydosporia 170 TaxID=1380566 RepID=A0A219AP56_METCM|nr:NACHT and ankyrin domain protein [Pochonia chlamydosporia 170]OWT42618.1 NACHT and ankyrin domain protein [Pochonia chlamydosporia 170]
MSKRPIPIENAPEEGHGRWKRPRTPLNEGLTLPVRSPRRYANEDYTVGWICALVTEYVAAQALLDETHEQPIVSRHDEGDYVLGKFGRHNVVLAVMPGGEYGNSSATATAKDLRNTFPNITFGLMVGIGGGAPSPRNDIRLGDVVVSLPSNGRGGVFQYDFGKTIQNQAFRTTGFLNQPPRILRSAVNGLKAQYKIRGHKFRDTIEDVFKRIPRLKSEYKRPDPTSDRLYKSDFLHPADNGASCTDTCGADPRTLVSRLERKEDEDNPVVHYGLIASADTLMKDAKLRDRLVREKDVLCFEMEAAGLMNNFPCLVIRGICDYSDTHKSKDWQGYAAMTAAAYAKDLLLRISLRDVESLRETRRNSPERIDVTDRESPIDEEKLRLFLNSLRFDTINNRQQLIKDAHAKTCEWLLDEDQYLDWLNPDKLEEHQGFLWIKGKPGAGKSTLMNYAYTKALKKMKNTSVVAFFFNARGHTLEKTMVGMYRSLLLQLLKKIPKLQAVISLPETATSNNYQWSIALLQSMFKQAILGLDRSCVICFIDALDECEEAQVRDMIKFLERLSLSAVSCRINFRVCFASRYYPNISIAKGLTLELEKQMGHTKDITAYIETELKIDDSPTSDEIRFELREKASGVFMWVFLVIDILNTASDRGRCHNLKQKLREIPGTLHELFRDMLKRDEHNKDELLLCIQWVLFARQPLSPRELYFAILAGTVPDVISTLKSGAIPLTTIKKFILDASKGLLELTTSDTPTVQFIHESVKDFLIKDNGLSEICSYADQGFLARSHERLKTCCVDYLGNASVSLVDDETMIIGTFRQAAKIRESRFQESPFLQYAVQNILYHADLAAEQVDQTKFLQNFPRTRWMRLVNIYRQTVHRYQNASLLYILAEQNCGSLIKHQSNSLSCFEIENERYYTPIFASLCTKSHKATRGLLQALAESQGYSSAAPDICEQYDRMTVGISESDELDAVISRRKAPYDICELPYELNNEIIWHAFLIAYNYSDMQVTKTPKGPLIWALENSNRQLLKIMLENGVDIETRIYKDTLLQHATRYDQKALVKFLLEKGADIEAPGETVLQLALSRRNRAMVQLLLDNGAKADYLNAKTQRNLQNAIYCRQEAIVKVLLENGANTEAEDSFGRTPLHEAVACKSAGAAIVALLLEGGANIEAVCLSDLRKWTPLLEATYWGHEAIVKLLLDNGANIEAVDFKGNTPLCLAVADNREEIVALLLERGANTETVYLSASRKWTPLLEATERGNKAIVKLLLENGANTKAVDFLERTPLHVAVAYKSAAIIALLLGNGANMEAVDSEGNTPLRLAVADNSEAIVALLLERGASIESLDPGCRTAVLGLSKLALFTSRHRPTCARPPSPSASPRIVIDLTDTD